MGSRAMHCMGFFEELGFGLGPPAVLAFYIDEEPDSCEPGLVHYLENAPVIAMTMCDDTDWLCPGKTVSVAGGLSSDGVWVWPCVLAYYVATYHVRLPGSFIEHARNRSWSPPDLSDEEQDKLAREFFSWLGSKES